MFCYRNSHLFKMPQLKYLLRSSCFSNSNSSCFSTFSLSSFPKCFFHSFNIFTNGPSSFETKLSHTYYNSQPFIIKKSWYQTEKEKEDLLLKKLRDWYKDQKESEKLKSQERIRFILLSGISIIILFIISSKEKKTEKEIKKIKENIQSLKRAYQYHGISFLIHENYFKEKMLLLFSQSSIISKKDQNKKQKKVSIKNQEKNSLEEDKQDALVQESDQEVDPERDGPEQEPDLSADVDDDEEDEDENKVSLQSKKINLPDNEDIHSFSLLLDSSMKEIQQKKVLEILDFINREKERVENEIKEIEEQIKEIKEMKSSRSKIIVSPKEEIQKLENVLSIKKRKKEVIEELQNRIKNH